MTTAMTKRNEAHAVSSAESALIMNDLAGLNDSQRLDYYGRVCASLGLNPLTQPFGYITLNNKLVLYAKRDATDQLRRLHGVTCTIMARERIEDLYIVTARATLPGGRTDESTGVVSLSGLRGADLANALMKAETKAKRRVTLSICGLGWLDETEADGIGDQPAPSRPAARAQTTANALPAPAPESTFDPNAEPRPDAELSLYQPDGTPVWKVAGVECMLHSSRRYLVSTDPCPDHEQPFLLPLDSADTDWRHGRAPDVCHLSAALARQGAGVASDLGGLFNE